MFCAMLLPITPRPSCLAVRPNVCRDDDFVVLSLRWHKSLKPLRRCCCAHTEARRLACLKRRHIHTTLLLRNPLPQSKSNFLGLAGATRAVAEGGALMLFGVVVHASGKAPSGLFCAIVMPCAARVGSWRPARKRGRGAVFSAMRRGWGITCLIVRSGRQEMGLTRRTALRGGGGDRSQKFDDLLHRWKFDSLSRVGAMRMAKVVWQLPGQCCVPWLGCAPPAWRVIPGNGKPHTVAVSTPPVTTLNQPSATGHGLGSLVVDLALAGAERLVRCRGALLVRCRRRGLVGSTRRVSERRWRGRALALPSIDTLSRAAVVGAELLDPLDGSLAKRPLDAVAAVELYAHVLLGDDHFEPPQQLFGVERKAVLVDVRWFWERSLRRHVPGIAGDSPWLASPGTCAMMLVAGAPAAGGWRHRKRAMSSTVANSDPPPPPDGPSTSRPFKVEGLGLPVWEQLEPEQPGDDVLSEGDDSHRRKRLKLK
ncbi:hypothetical protein BKA63DRAFT_558903 [Paraphoma chrysanthemicola]|nr:hypothetical protein BKA63DRAFT_558903 [Paraphoma chrysanthemicola]